MEIRKQKEAEFHNQVRKGLAEGSKKYQGFVRRRKFYSVTRKSVSFFRDFLIKNCRGKKVLDFGCGEGDLALFLAENGADVTGIDISSESIKIAKEKAVNKKMGEGISFLVMDGEKLEFTDKSFDLITCSGILHHLDVSRAYQEMSRVLKLEGKIICNEPLIHNPIFQFYRRLTPHLRSEWEIEHILSKKDIKLAEKYFGKVEKRFFHLSDLLAVPFQETLLFKPVLWFFEKIDFFILFLPFIKWWAWQIVFILSQPKN